MYNFHYGSQNKRNNPAETRTLGYTLVIINNSNSDIARISTTTPRTRVFCVINSNSSISAQYTVVPVHCPDLLDLVKSLRSTAGVFLLVEYVSDSRCKH